VSVASPPLPSRASARAGATAIAPIAIGMIPFGLIVGLSAVEAGLTLPETVALSVGVFAGAS
jgi:predicted branched-subunit amino acid permease